MRTSPPPSGRSASCRGRTRTAPGPSPAAGRSRSGAELIRLYADYLHGEYGDIDSDYVLSRCPDNTYCPEPGVIRTGLAQLLVIAMTMFREYDIMALWGYSPSRKARSLSGGW